MIERAEMKCPVWCHVRLPSCCHLSDCGHTTTVAHGAVTRSFCAGVCKPFSSKLLRLIINYQIQHRTHTSVGRHMPSRSMSTELLVILDS